MKKMIIISIIMLILAGCGSQNINNDANITTKEPDSVETSSVSTDNIAWGFVRKKGECPDVPDEWKTLLNEHSGYYLVNSNEKKIYLTFDEGYENGFTAKILDVLKENQVKAIFFVTGPYLEGQKELIERMIAEGHYVGNHTVHHPNLSTLSEEEIQNELGALNAKCEELYQTSMTYMRPPEGAFNERVLTVAQNMGYKTILWSHAYKDWDVDMQKGTEYAINQVVPYTHNGEILLLHAVSKDNAEALNTIISQIREMGFEFGDPAEIQ